MTLGLLINLLSESAYMYSRCAQIYRLSYARSGYWALYHFSVINKLLQNNTAYCLSVLVLVPLILIASFQRSKQSES